MDLPRGLRSRDGWRAGALLALALLLPMPRVAAAQAGDGRQGIETALARMAEQNAELERQLELEPDHPTAWALLVQGRLMEWLVRRRHEGSAPTAEENVEFQRGLHREWMAAQPWNAQAYIGYTASYPVAERADMMVELCDGLPEAPALLERTLFTLRHAGQSERATQLAERYLAGSPGNSGVWAQVHGHYSQLGQKDRADEVLDRWLGSLPGDGEALKRWYTRQRTLAGGDRARARELAAEALARLAPSAAGRGLCEAIRLFEDLALDCYSSLLGADLGDDDEQRVLAGMARLAGAGGAGDLDSLLAALSPEMRERTLANLAAKAAERGDCAQSLGHLEALGFRFDFAGHPVAVALRGCDEEPGARDRLLALLPKLTDQALRSVLSGLPADRPYAAVEEEAYRRLAEGGETFLWTALDGLYRRSERQAERLQNFRLWSEALGPRFRHYDDWAGLLLFLGRRDEAIGLLERATRPGGPADHVHGLEMLVDLYLGAARLDDAAALVARVRDKEGPDSKAPRGDLLLGRLSWVQGDVAEAEAAYRRHLERNPTLLGEALREYAVLAVAAGHADDLLDLLEEAYEVVRRQRNMSISGSLDSWVAARLEELGLYPQALAYLERAVAGEPGELGLLDRLARAAAAAGETERAERALRRMIAADPASVGPWVRLADLHMAAEEPRRARQLLAEAPATARAASAAIDLALARAHEAEGDLYGAIGELRRTRERWSRNASVADALRAAYRRLAEAEAEAAGEEADSSVADGEGAEAEAKRGIDSYRRAAAAGDPRAMLAVGEAYMGAREGREIDYPTALSWLERAADAGLPGAMTRIGELHARGRLGPPDARVANDWYRRAAALGEGLAMYHLANAHFRGDGAARDYAGALDWLRRSAETGFIHAVYELAELYDTGLEDGETVILEPDLERSAAGYREAAAQGNVQARGWLVYYERELR